MASGHVPVLLQEILGLLAPAPGETFLDGTVGAGDFRRFRRAFGSVLGDPAFDPAVDSDGDGAIGEADFGHKDIELAVAAGFEKALG